MVQTIQASLVKMSDLKNKFGLTLSTRSSVFCGMVKGVYRNQRVRAILARSRPDQLFGIV